jgi:hypothetical protein
MEKKFKLVEILNGCKTGESITLTEDEYNKLNLKNVFKIHKGNNVQEIAVDNTYFKSLKS